MDDLIRRMAEQDQMMRRLAEGPLKDFREMEDTIARMTSLARGLDTSFLDKAAAAASAADLPLRLPALADGVTAPFANLKTPDLITALDSYAHEARKMQETIERVSQAPRVWAEQIAAFSSCIEATRFTLPTIDFDQVGGLIAASAWQSDRLARLTDRLLFRHTDLMESLGRTASELASIPLVLSGLPAMDVFVHTSAVRSITPHEALDEEDEERAAPLRLTIVTETTLFLEQTLPELKPAFLKQYRGMKARAADRGPDGWTQGSASMRKLLKGVLHIAAPNELVLPWATRNNRELDRNGRPTRATKVEWLCQFTPDDAYRAYVRTELNSALALIELLDTAQHVDEFPAFEDQYEWIMLRTEVAIRHMLELWKQGR